MRRGSGITGLGVAHINSPKISGRLTVNMLQRMAAARKDDQFDVGDDNEFEQVRKLLKRKK